MSGPYTHVSGNTAKDKCRSVYGISEREKFSDDI